jgi:hypothetical protein
LPIGTPPLQYGVFTAGTGFTQPNGIGTSYLVSSTTVYAANCKGGCTPGAKVVPGITVASASIPIVAPGTEFAPRNNEVDLGLSRTFTFSTREDHAEAGYIQRAQLGRLLGGDQHAVWRGHLRGAVGDSAGPDHPREY